MKTEIFLNHCDPRIGETPEQILATVNFNSLLFETGVIQDNFLISQILFDINQKYTHGHIVELLEKGIVKIAVREKANDSTSTLKEQLEEKAYLPPNNSGRYIPFEPDAQWKILYRDREFNFYLKQLDSSLSNGNGKYKNWNPAELGRNYRQLMMKSAYEGNTPLAVLEPIEVFQEIDNSITDADDKKHSRTLYYDYAETLSDKTLSETIKKWADWNYAINLPDNLLCGMSISKEKLVQEYAHTPIYLEDWNNPVIPITSNISAKIFSPEFLTGLTANDILRIRSYSDFRELQAILRNGSDDQVLKLLRNYLELLSQEAERIYLDRKSRKRTNTWSDSKIDVVPGMFGPRCLNDLYGTVFILNTIPENAKSDIKKEILDRTKGKQDDNNQARLGFSIHQACTVDVQPPTHI